MNNWDQTTFHSVTSQGIPAQVMLTICDYVEE